MQAQLTESLPMSLNSISNPLSVSGGQANNMCPHVEKIPWRKKWQPTPVFLPGNSHGQRSLAGYSPWGCKGQTQLSNCTTTMTKSQPSNLTVGYSGVASPILSHFLSRSYPGTYYKLTLSINYQKWSVGPTMNNKGTPIQGLEITSRSHDKDHTSLWGANCLLPSLPPVFGILCSHRTGVLIALHFSWHPPLTHSIPQFRMSSL